MNSDFYAILPLILVYEEKYSMLSSKAILLYALFLNRAKFSLQNKKFRDSDGIFIYYSTGQISKHIHCSISSARKTLCELENAGLVKIKFQEFGRPLKIYVNDIRAGDKGANSVASEKPQDKLSGKPYSNSIKHQKPYINKISQEEKQVSFDVELQEKLERNNLCRFSEKTKKRRTRNIGPTI